MLNILSIYKTTIVVYDSCDQNVIVQKWQYKNVNICSYMTGSKKVWLISYWAVTSNKTYVEKLRVYIYTPNVKKFEHISQNHHH